jgi:hypothetical protein
MHDKSCRKYSHEQHYDDGSIIGDRECGGRIEDWDRTNGAVEVAVVMQQMLLVEVVVICVVMAV